MYYLYRQETLTHSLSNRYRVPKTMIGLGHEEIINLNVLPEYGSLVKYRASLGHKVNHSFKNFNAIFGKAFHPRFGDIKSIYAEADIKKGEEILVHYGYQPGGLVPKWVSDLYFEETGKEWHSNEGKKSKL